jgi:phosphatidylinositol phospholipase C, delta
VEDGQSDSGTNTTESGTESDTVASPSEGKRPKLHRRRSSGQSAVHKGSKISPILSDMAVYTKAYKWRNFQRPESTFYNHVFSFSEPKIKEFFKNTNTNHQVERHNLRYLMRVYPGFTRFTSNNFDPTMFWKKGVQMVALNWQKYGTLPTKTLLTTDLGMQIHEALFQANYQHGYILKPTSLLESSHPPSYHHLSPYESKSCKIKLDVQVISGQQLPRPKDYKPGQAVDPYVQIEMICPNGQTIEGRTCVVRDNEFNPMWDERLSFDVVTPSREFVFVRYTQSYNVADDRLSLHNGDKSAGNNLFGSYCIRLQDLHQGIPYSENY